jgi:hypothetical protein
MVNNLVSRFGVIALLTAVSCTAAEKFTYNTLADLIQDLKYNEVRRDRIVRKTDDPEMPLVTVRSVRVQSVVMQTIAATGKSAMVMTYQIVKNSLMFGAVYFGEILPPSKAADLHHDQLVSIVGGVFSYEPSGDNPVDVVRILGVVVPVPKAPQQGKVK